jgi:alanine racemase
MRRQGILPEELDEALSLIQNSGSIQVTGICSHLYDADNADLTITETQVKVWNKVVDKMKNAFPLMKHIHLNNTDGHRFRYDTHSTMSRLGGGLYGLADGSSFSPKLDLRPPLEMKTIITGLKKLKTGETVGYNGTFKANKNMDIATIPVGYNEGLDRRLSNKGMVLVGEDRVPCPIVGRVSMNITVIDVTGIPNVKARTPVIVISANSKDVNSMMNMAKQADAHPYEIAVHLPVNLKRVIV